MNLDYLRAFVEHRKDCEGTWNVREDSRGVVVLSCINGIGKNAPYAQREIDALACAEPREAIQLMAAAIEEIVEDLFPGLRARQKRDRLMAGCHNMEQIRKLLREMHPAGEPMRPSWKKRAKRWPLLAALLLAGCQVHASSFHLEGFSPEEGAAIEAGAELWSAAGYPTTIKADGDGTIVKLPFCGDLQDGEVVGYDGCHVVGQASEWVVIIDNADVRAAFPADTWLSHVRMVAAHELGHYHGFQDTRQRGHVMTWVAQERGEALP